MLNYIVNIIVVLLKTTAKCQILKNFILLSEATKVVMQQKSSRPKVKPELKTRNFIFVGSSFLNGPLKNIFLQQIKEKNKTPLKNHIYQKTVK